jgi:XTP/dITP diphosphohydrolase
MKLIFATNNKNKVEEIKHLTNQKFQIFTLQEVGIDIDIPEPHDTLEANATEKSMTIFKLTNEAVFSEDTGLEVTALGGAPGVKSARYAGEGRNMQDNIDKLLHELKDKPSRAAQFRTVASLIINGKEYQFEGICKGHITTTQDGTNGFGYDPVFIPEGSDTTFANMDVTEKNKYSHRKKAVQKLIDFLNDYQPTL